MMKEMIRKVMEWCKLWNGETATAKQAGPSSDQREKEQAADNREVQDRLLTERKRSASENRVNPFPRVGKKEVRADRYPSRTSGDETQGGDVMA